MISEHGKFFEQFSAHVWQIEPGPQTEATPYVYNTHPCVWERLSVSIIYKPRNTTKVVNKQVLGYPITFIAGLWCSPLFTCGCGFKPHSLHMWPALLRCHLGNHRACKKLWATGRHKQTWQKLCLRVPVTQGQSGHWSRSYDAHFFFTRADPSSKHAYACCIVLPHKRPGWQNFLGQTVNMLATFCWTYTCHSYAMGIWQNLSVNP